MKFYFPFDELNPLLPRQYLAEWIKPLFPEPRHSIYGLKSKDLEMSETLGDADAFLLPLTWNYYLETGTVTKAIALIKEYNTWRKPVFTWAGFACFIATISIVVFKKYKL